MSILPTPAALAAPIVNPNVGSWGRPLPYLSVSQYQAAPTALDLSNLVSNSVDSDGYESNADAASQVQALADVLRRASSWADKFVFGADPAGRGASLCMTQTQEASYFRFKQNGILRVICDYKPVVELDGMSIGYDPSSLMPVDSSVAKRIAMPQMGGRTINVPLYRPPLFTTTPAPSMLPSWTVPGMLYVLWSYWNGYTHLSLAQNAAQGATAIVVSANAANNVVKGLYDGYSTVTIYDMTDLSSPAVEDVTVQSVVGTTINLTSGLQFAHYVPEAPDFIPVSMMPYVVGQAVIFLASALIKSRGDDAIELQGITEPSSIKSGADSGIVNDVKTAFEMLADFRITSKVKN